jgi:hypothetical protein
MKALANRQGHIVTADLPILGMIHETPIEEAEARLKKQGT